MQVLINHLIQLQELTLVRDEQKVSLAGAYTAQLDEAIREMKGRLPPGVAAQFDRLHAKHTTVMSPMAEGLCAMCGMKLPISLVQAVRLGRELQSCPTCARVLYAADAAPKRVSTKTLRGEPRKMGIARFSCQDLMLPDMTAATKEGAIGDLAASMEKAGFVNRADTLAESAMKREAIISTAVDHGIAFPHVRGVEGGGLALALGTSRKGIKWDGARGKPAKIIFFMTIPSAASAFYLKLLAGLAETFASADARKALMDAGDPAGLWRGLQKLTRSSIK
jgi:mannitol/fructose-specific phosphotransferase system IIA component (Ntr-type)